MQRTFVLIPHEIAGIPVLGFGWLLMFLVIALVARIGLAWHRSRHGGPSVMATLISESVMWMIAAVAIAYVLPAVELTNVDGEPVGMAIRGYGVMLLTGVSAAVALATVRARRAGLPPELILTLAPWAFFGGIIGARLFFVIQYRDQFIVDSLGQTIANILRFTEGGLVVYGSFIGGFIAVAFYLVRHRLSVLTFGDVIIPCLFVGIFFGRIGCLMNGCCYGGRCEDQLMAVQFPAGSPVYEDQIRSGELLGFTYDPDTFIIDEVSAGSLAAEAGIERGSRVETIRSDPSPFEDASRAIPSEEVRTGVIATIDGRRYRWTPQQLPSRALPVFAAQLLSSFTGLVLCLALCGISMMNLRTGTVMMLGFASYAILRFVLELVRVDEGGQFGTSLSISQWVSAIVLTGSIIGLCWIYRQPKNPALQPQPTS